MTDLVELRLVDEDGLRLLEQLTQDPANTGEFAWFGWSDPGRYRRRWAEDGLLGEESGILLVVRAEQRLGIVNWRRRPLTSGAFAWEIGIGLAPQARGQGYGTRAQQELVRYLFAHTTVYRIEAATEAGNLAEQRALEKAGFTRESIRRAAVWRDGAWRDSVIYSILRSDPGAQRCQNDVMQHCQDEPSPP